jgi:hypothetical protein
LKVIFDVSTNVSIAPHLAKQPMEAEDNTFARPREYYDCGKLSGGCGVGTKRTPNRICGIN